MKKCLSLLTALALLLGCAAAENVEPGLLRCAILYDISTMDVAETTDDYMIPMNVMDRLFETKLVDGKAALVNSLATDFSVSEDGRTYRFTLRDGVVFSNGSALTASDVQYSFERLLKVGHQNTDIPLEIEGGEALMKGEADSLKGFQVEDDTHFTVTLTDPNAGFTAELSSPAMSIVDAETMARVTGFGSEPEDTIGSGPYIVTEWVANDHYTLVYNERYWGPEPSVKKLIVRVEPDAGTQNLKFQGGELDLIDLANLDSVIVASAYKPVMADRIVSTPRVGLTFLVLNEQNEFLKDVRVRKAIGMAVNADAIIQGIYMGDAIRENGIIPTGVWGHNDALEGFAFDPEGARKLLAEAGYADGQIHFEIAMNTSSNTSVQLICASISQNLEAVGIRAEIVSYDHSSWLAKRGSGTMDSLVGTWGMDYNDPANIMYTFFGSEANSHGRSLNYADPETIRRVAAARAIVDDAARMAEYQTLEKKLI
ncbi:MAG: ABC transporter substrate-binding protein, partial [Clostridia bacterium]|nr:ABC transporter substrate-binding protein [Clostridia bacterium]